MNYEDRKLAEENLREFTQVDQTDNKEIDNVLRNIHRSRSNGEYKTISGVFNKNTGEVIDGRKLTSKQIDDELRDIHRRNVEIIIITQ
jgi:hypothetical protein